ncbi:M23 family metallopeptidase [Bradyrhizobium sp. 930_D9_N1_4]|uniref:M23 family metallopeptidase n=1 Tax=Bradyrhizobium sp. 930_D9_N1_4 TaxID=3240374 RepID=UPI003F8AC534
MRFKDVQDLMLPPINGVGVHTTVPSGDFGAGEAQGRHSPSSIPHTGVDMNYFGGQSGINLRHPDVHSPVSGTVRKAGYGKSKRISIEDANGIVHDILHTKDQFVTAGQKVFAGEKIGTMGNSGTKDHHVHYEIGDSAGNVLNPHSVWEQYLEEHQRYLDATGAGFPDGAARDMRRPASPNVLSPDAARRITGAPSTAPVPFVDGATRAQQALDNSLPAPGSAPWGLSDRFGNWRGVSGVFGPANSGGSGGLGRTGDGNSFGVRNEQFARMDVDPSKLMQRGTASEISGGTPSLAPARFPLEALLAPDPSRGLNEWASSLRGRSAPSAVQGVAIGLANPKASVAGGDPSSPDRVPAGGLLGVIQDYMRSNGY